MRVALSLKKSVSATLVFCFLPLVRNQWETLARRIDVESANLLCHLAAMPPCVVQQLLVSGEDHRHSQHLGFDIIAICRAIWRRFSQKKREGASTIEQQIVRTILGRREPTMRRKMNEIMLSTVVSSVYPKNILPAVYLSMGYYGWRMNGYREACRRLNLNPRAITLMDAALLVARLKYPEPRVAPSARMQQINYRAQHLIKLYNRHLLDGTYGYLYGIDPFRSGCRASKVTPPIPRPGISKSGTF